MSNLLKCGVLDCGTGYSDVLLDPETDDLIVDSDLLGCCLLGDLCGRDPLVVDDSTYEKMCETYNCDGIILLEAYIIRLYMESMTAEYYEYGAEKPKHTVKFNTDVAYE